MRTWYGWNLDTWAGEQFAKRVTMLHEKRRRNPKLKLRHPFVKLSHGGLWKPLTIRDWAIDGLTVYRWRKWRRSYL